MIFKRILFYLSSLLSTVACVKQTHTNNQTVPSPSYLIDRGLAALGGEDVVRNISTVTYQTP